MAHYTRGKVLLGRYHIEKMIATGGFCVVYQAHDRETDTLVAIKHFVAPLAKPAAVAALRLDFQREAIVLRDLKHDRVPRVHSFFEHAKELFLVMDYIRGKRLNDIASPTLPAADVLDWSIQICATLTYLHSIKPCPVVHRDLTPHNLLLTDRGIMLIDFGLACMVGRPTNKYTDGAGTLGFMPPEIIAGQAADPSVDLYSLGATMYTLLTGKGPCDALQRQQALLNGGPDPLKGIATFRNDVPLALLSAVDQLMAVRRDERCSSAVEALQLFERTREAWTTVGG